MNKKTKKDAKVFNVVSVERLESYKIIETIEWKVNPSY
jgi:hypothetical protein